MMNYDLTFLTLFLKLRLYLRQSLLCQLLIYKSCTHTRMRSFTVHTYQFKRTQLTSREVLILAPARAPVRMRKSALWACPVLKQVLLNLFSLAGLYTTTCSLELHLQLTIWITFKSFFLEGLSLEKRRHCTKFLSNEESSFNLSRERLRQATSR